MPDFPDLTLPAPTVVTPFHLDSLGTVITSAGLQGLSGAASAIWPTNNKAFIYPFQLTGRATVYQLFFWVGATSAGNIDVGIYDQQKNLLVSAGSTAMSATVNTLQMLNVTDTVLGPGGYLLAGVCSTTSGTVFRTVAASDEVSLSMFAVYEQTTALPLPNPLVPVLTTDATPPIMCIGAVLGTVF